MVTEATALTVDRMNAPKAYPDVIVDCVFFVFQQLLDQVHLRFWISTSTVNCTIHRAKTIPMHIASAVIEISRDGLLPIRI